MLSTNGKKVVFAGSFSIKAGEEVVLSPDGLDGHTFRFNAVENVNVFAGMPSGFDTVEKVTRLPIPLIERDATGLENEFLGLVGQEKISMRVILQGAGKFTVVHVEVYLS